MGISYSAHLTTSSSPKLERGIVHASLHELALCWIKNYDRVVEIIGSFVYGHHYSQQDRHDFSPGRERAIYKMSVNSLDRMSHQINLNMGLLNSKYLSMYVVSIGMTDNEIIRLVWNMLILKKRFESDPYSLSLTKSRPSVSMTSIKIKSCLSYSSN